MGLRYSANPGSVAFDIGGSIASKLPIAHSEGVVLVEERTSFGIDLLVDSHYRAKVVASHHINLNAEIPTPTRVNHHIL
jgi:hypothetical protein